MANPVLDPMEAVLLEGGPNHGLYLGDRVTCLDMRLMASGDDLFGQASPDELVRTAQQISGEISAEQGERDNLPIFVRKETSGLYTAELTVRDYERTNRIQNQADIDSVIQAGNYGLSVEMFLEGEYLFGVHIGQHAISLWDFHASSCDPLLIRMEDVARQYPQGTTIQPKSFTRTFLETLE